MSRLNSYSMGRLNSFWLLKHCVVVAIMFTFCFTIWSQLHVSFLPPFWSPKPKYNWVFNITGNCSSESFLFDVYKEHIPSLQQLNISTECKNWNISLAEDDRHLALYSDSIELDYFFNRINCLTPTVYARYGDGEYMLMYGIKVSYTQRNEWLWDSPNTSKAGWELKEMAAQSKQNGYLIGIPCIVQKGIPHTKGIIKRLLKVVTAGNTGLTYNILLRDANRIRFKSYMSNFLIPNFRTFQIILFINNEIAKLNQEYFDCNLFWATDVYYVQDDMINKYENNKPIYDQQWAEIAQKYREKAIFLLSTGPIAEVMLHRMFKANPNNLYLDIGSSLDEFVRGHVTRHYYDDVRCSDHGRYGRVGDQWECMFDCPPENATNSTNFE